MIQPSKGFAFIKEDKKSFKSAQEVGIEIPEHVKKNVGSYGTILWVNNERGGKIYSLWQYLFSKDAVQNFHVGQRVIFSRFVAEQIYIEDDNGNEIPNIRSVPTDCILAIIT